MLPYIPFDFWHFICRHFRNLVETQPTSASLRNASRRSHRPRPNKNGDFMRDFIWWKRISKWTWMDSHSSHQSEKCWFHMDFHGVDGFHADFTRIWWGDTLEHGDIYIYIYDVHHDICRYIPVSLLSYKVL